MQHKTPPEGGTIVKKSIPALLLALSLLSGCARATEAAFLKEVPLNSSTKQITVSEPIRTAMFDLTEELTPDYFKTSKKANQIFSPLSLWYALGILREGAAGATLAELDRMMKLTPGFDSASVIPELSKTLNFLETSKLAADGSKSGIRLTNGIFFERKYRKNIQAAYLEKAASIWGSESAAVDFTNQAETMKIIRDWVSQKTDAFIPDYEATFPTDGSAILNIYNVLYLKEQWLNPFAQLEAQTFNAPTGAVTVPYMGRREFASAYHQTTDYQAAAFSGEKGIRVWFILPAAGKTPLDLIPELADILADGDSQYLDFKAPLLDIDGENLSLKKLLMDKGYSLIFSSADFSPMLSGMSAAVGEIKQKTKLQMDRLGFKAAAVTEIGLTKAGIPGNPVPFHVDRPYLLAIEYQDLPLFVAQITNPAEK